MANDGPTPRHPNGPGSSQWPGALAGRIDAAIPTMSPPSPTTIASGSRKSRISRANRCGWIGLRVDCSCPPGPRPPRRFSSSRTSRGPRRLLRVADAPGEQLGDDLAGVTDDPHLDRPVAPDVRGVDVDLDHAGVRRNPRCPNPRRKSQSTPSARITSARAQRELPGGAEVVRMVGRQAAPAERVEEDGDLERVGQRGQGLVGLAPADPRPGEDQGRSASWSSLHGPGHVVRIALGLGLGPGRRPGRPRPGARN